MIMKIFNAFSQISGKKLFIVCFYLPASLFSLGCCLRNAEESTLLAAAINAMA